MRKQIRNLPKILNFVKKIHYFSKLFTSLLRRGVFAADIVNCLLTLWGLCLITFTHLSSSPWLFLAPGAGVRGQGSGVGRQAKRWRVRFRLCQSRCLRGKHHLKARDEQCNTFSIFLKCSVQFRRFCARQQILQISSTHH